MVKVSLKTVLKNFLNHYENLEERRNTDDDLYQREFQSLKVLTESLKTQPYYLCNEGLKDVNRRKNRYKDILPYDYSRVILSDYPGVPGSDYINANYVRGASGSSCAYIASQGPLPNTLFEFWRMIWETEVTVIVMACNETESGKYKCESYWPNDVEQPQQHGNITVSLVKWRQVCPDFLVRTFLVKADGNERTVCQFHYGTWPDHGTPSAVEPILELVRLMRDVQASEARPILVHCSAGCGRTGTICSIDYVWALLRTGKLTDDFSLYEIIKDMRRQRIAMVQTLEQYMLCYKAVAALFEQQLKMIDSHTYQNLDEDGEPLLLKDLDEGDLHSSNESTSNRSNVTDSVYQGDGISNVRQLIESFQFKNDHESESTISSNSSVEVTQSSSLSLLNDSKREKLVGKATVIRRPSVSKLKAIFESSRSSEEDPELRTKTLHRSFSALGRTFNQTNALRVVRPSATASNLSSLANQAENEQWQSNYNEQRKQCNEIANRKLNERSALRLSQKKFNASNMEQPARVVDLSRENPSLQQYRKSSRQCDYSYFNQPPPKPPRTYEHVVTRDTINGSRSSYESSVESSGGRLMMSVALPKQQQVHQQLAPKYHLSAPNLSIPPTYEYNTSVIENKPMITNLPVYNIKSSHNQQLGKIPTNHEPIYYDGNDQPSNSVYESVSSRNVYQIPMNQKGPQTSNRPTRNFNAAIYDSNKNMVSKPTAPVYRNQNGAPVTYVRPQRQVKEVKTVTPTPPIPKPPNPPKGVKVPAAKGAKVAPTVNNGTRNLPDNVNKERKSFLGTSFFKFSKSKSSKQSQTSSHSGQSTSTVSGPNLIRPPHCHRFNETTQWTQV